MKRLLMVCALAGLAVACGGCGAETMRPWQQQPLPTHDAASAFAAAREVLSEHFKIASADFAKGAIETKPERVDKPRGTRLADIRGAGGRWRQTAYFELDREGLGVTGRVAVRLEREVTAEAVAGTDMMDSDVRTSELPRSGARYNKPPSKPADQVWMDVGYDAGVARELLSKIADLVAKGEKGEEMPGVPTSKDIPSEIHKMGKP
jgi:hypothetical protein